MELCQPARSVTRRPALVAPPGACDCHCHIIGPQSRFPFVPDRSFTAPDALEADYLAMLSTLGFERTVIIQPSLYGADNTRLIAAVEAIGIDRARAVAMISPEETEAEIRRLDQAGVRAARFITTAAGGPSIDHLEDMARLIAPFGWHIELYVPPMTWPGLLPIIERLPVPVVLDHMAALRADMARNDPVVADAILRLLDRGQCWVKLCGYRASDDGSPYADVLSLAKLLIEHGAERCVWGTDWPHTNIVGYMPDDGDLLDLLLEWAPDESLRKAILVDNPAKLYRFE